MLTKAWSPASASRKARTREEWWADRGRWAVAGAASAAGGQIAALKGLKGVVGRPHKQALVEVLAENWPEEKLSQRPGLTCVPHTKRNEMGGKERAIYWVDAGHYLIA